MNSNSISSDTLKQASEIQSKIEALQGQLDAATAQVNTLTAEKTALQTQLNTLLGRPEPKHTQRNFSAESIARISAAQKARWAKVKAAQAAAPAVAALATPEPVTA